MTNVWSHLCCARYRKHMHDARPLNASSTWGWHTHMIINNLDTWAKWPWSWIIPREVGVTLLAQPCRATPISCWWTCPITIKGIQIWHIWVLLPQMSYKWPRLHNTHYPWPPAVNMPVATLDYFGNYYLGSMLSFVTCQQLRVLHSVLNCLLSTSST